MGCIAAGAPQQKQEAAENYANALGFAFQIIDDILDVEGDAKAIGKPIGSDAENKKRTYVAIHGLEQAKEAANRFSLEAMTALKEFRSMNFLIGLPKILHRETIKDKRLSLSGGSHGKNSRVVS